MSYESGKSGNSLGPFSLGANSRTGISVKLYALRDTFSNADYLHKLGVEQMEVRSVVIRLEVFIVPPCPSQHCTCALEASEHRRALLALSDQPSALFYTEILYDEGIQRYRCPCGFSGDPDALREHAANKDPTASCCYRSLFC